MERDIDIKEHMRSNNHFPKKMGSADINKISASSLGQILFYFLKYCIHMGLQKTLLG